MQARWRGPGVGRWRTSGNCAKNNSGYLLFAKVIHAEGYNGKTERSYAACFQAQKDTHHEAISACYACDYAVLHRYYSRPYVDCFAFSLADRCCSSREP